MSTNVARIYEFRPRADQTVGAAGDIPQKIARDETEYSTSTSPLTRTVQSGVYFTPTKFIQIMDLGSQAVALRTPIPVSIEELDGNIVARSYDLDLFEVGETEGEALDGLREMIVEFYLTLRGDTARSEYLERKFDFLNSLVRCP